MLERRLFATAPTRCLFFPIPRCPSIVNPSLINALYVQFLDVHIVNPSLINALYVQFLEVYFGSFIGALPV